MGPPIPTFKKTKYHKCHCVQTCWSTLMSDQGAHPPSTMRPEMENVIYLVITPPVSALVGTTTSWSQGCLPLSPTLSILPLQGQGHGPYHGAYCNLEGLVLDLDLGQGQGQARVLWQTLRVEVVLASAAASQASDACLALPSAGGPAMAGPWPTSYRPLSEL